jgi:mevalonate kinase
MAIVASAPAKAILFGEHAVNRRQLALATAIDRRVLCRVVPRADGIYTLRSGERREEITRGDLLGFKARIDGLRADEALDQIRECARQDFFAPTCWRCWWMATSSRWAS